MKRVTFGVAVALLVVTSMAYGKIWYVHPDSSIKKIQAGLDSCRNSDIVLVGRGTYVENIIWPNTRSIHLISEFGARATIIDADSAGRAVTCSTSTVDRTTLIRGFTMTRGYAYEGGGLLCFGCSPSIMDNIFTGNSSYTYGGGGVFVDSGSPLITGNTFSNNRAETNGGGICCWRYCNATIEYNVVTGNQAVDLGGGIRCGPNSGGEMKHNTVTLNRAQWGGGIAFDWSSTTLVDSNEITYNRADVKGGGMDFYYQGCAPLVFDNTMQGNTAPNGAGLYVDYQAAPVIQRNLITGNTTDAGGRGGGMFFERGGGGRIVDNTITGNRSGFQGGGAAVYDNAAVTFIDNTISGNTAGSSGGGIACEAATAVIESCRVVNNGVDGFWCGYGANVTIHYCNITGNDAYAVRNIDSTNTTNAENNWWGDSTGPYHPTQNPGGRGDTVSNYVDFIPWSRWPVSVEEEQSDARCSILDTRLRIYPNPFRSRVTITLNGADQAISGSVGSGPGHQQSALNIYDAAGRVVRSFDVTSHVLRPTSFVSWNGCDDRGQRLPAGVYMVRFTAGEHQETQKLVMLR